MASESPRVESPLPRAWPLVLVGLFLASLLVRLPNIGGYLDVDSVDYVRAARMGFRVNALDLGSRPIKTFVGDCARVFSGEADVHIWATDIKNNDVAAFRHYHPPLPFYLLCGWMRVFGSSNAALVLLSTIIGALMAPVLVWSWRTLFPAQSVAPGLLAGLFAVVDPLLSVTGKGVSAHCLFCLLAFLALVFLARAIRDGSARDLYGAAVLLGLCSATSEYALALLASCAPALVLARNPWISVTRREITIRWTIVGTLLVTFMVFFVLWPAGVLKLGLAKGYLQVLSVSLGRRGEFSPFVGLGRFLVESPVLIIFVALGLALGVRRLVERRVPGWLWSLACFPVVVFVGNLRSALTLGSYYCAVLPYIMLLAGWALWTLAVRTVPRPAIACAVMVALCAAVNTPGLARAGIHGLPFWPQIIPFFKQNALEGDRVFVSDNLNSGILAYYALKLAIDYGYRWPAAIQQSAEKIRRGEYRFVMLVSEARACYSGAYEVLPVSALPYYPLVKEKYRLVREMHGADGISVELYEWLEK